MAGGYFAFQFVVTLYLQNSLGWSPLAMAFGFLPAGLLVVASATKMGTVLERVGTPRLIFGGLSAFVLGYLLFLRVQPGMNYVNFLLPTMLLLGVGFALSFPSINAQATAGVAPHEQGLASGLVNTSIQIGGAIVLAVVTAILGNRPPAAAGELLPGMATTIAVVVGVSALGLLVTAGVLLARRRAEARAAVEPVAVTVDAAGVSAAAARLEAAGERDLALCEIC
jgi:sugar phosphate permease